MTSSRQPRTGEPPDAASLREAALAYLGRYAATEASLLRVLRRRVDRWSRAAEQAGGEAETIAAQRQQALVAAREVVERLARAGAVNDADFAEARARRLHRSGHSRRAVAAHLEARGVTREVAEAALPQDELAAALVFARRRRLGPFRASEPLEAAERHRTLGILARAGFTRPVVAELLEMAREDAENALATRRE